MRKLLFILMMTSIALGTMAQGKSGRRPGGQKPFDPQQFEQQLEQYIISKAELTSAESAKVLPIFREMRKKEVAVMEAQRKNFSGVPTTEQQCREAIKNHDASELQLKKIQQTYHQRMLKVLSATKTLRAIQASEEFHREALRKVEGMRHDDKPHKGKGPRGERRPKK